MRRASVWTVASLMALTGCNPNTPSPTVATPPSATAASAVTFDGVRYSSREAAREAYIQKVNADVDKVPPASIRLGGRGLVILPTRSEADRIGGRIKIAGNDTIGAVISDVTETQWLSNARSFEKARLFDTTTMLRSDDPAQVPSEGYDYILTFGKSPVGALRWRLSNAGSKGVDLPQPPNAANRLVAWNNLAILITNAGAELGAAVARRPAPVGVATMATPPSPSQPAQSTGTGFFVNRDGYVLTNAHVVNGCKTLKLQRGGDVPLDVAAVAQDNTNDLAVVKAPVPSPSHARFSNAPTRQGQDIVVFGFPLAGLLAAQGNLSTGVISALAGIANDTRQLQISAPVQPGNSGGPLMDGNGNVVGVIVSKINALNIARVNGDIPQNVNFAIKASSAMEFLQSNGVALDTHSSPKPMITADIADQAKTFTVMLTCKK